MAPDFSLGRQVAITQVYLCLDYLIPLFFLFLGHFFFSISCFYHRREEAEHIQELFWLIRLFEMVQLENKVKYCIKKINFKSPVGVLTILPTAALPHCKLIESP